MKFLNYSHKHSQVYASSFYSFFGILIPYTIVFLLVGEINLLKLDWNVEHQMSWQLYTIIFSLAFLGFFWMLIGLWTKTLAWEDFPFLASSVVLAISVFISSLIPLTNNEITNGLIILARVMIVLLSSIATFFINSKFIKFCLFKTTRVSKVIDKYSSIIESDFKSNKKYKLIVDLWKKKAKEEKDFVEVDEIIRKEK